MEENVMEEEQAYAEEAAEEAVEEGCAEEELGDEPGDELPEEDGDGSDEEEAGGEGAPMKGDAPHSDTVELTEEELDHIADTAIEALQGILKHFDVGEVTIDEYEGDEGELILDITGDNLAILIGRHGKTLEALQFIISAITTRRIGFRFPVIVDVEGYKNRQRQKLEALAASAARRAASQHRSVKMRPMTPYERRIVHIALRDDDRVETASEGEGPARHVVVIPC